jgi:hypothetical protein
MKNSKVKILYIGGYSRSGSTMLLRLLGRVGGAFSVGEMWDLWQRSFTENQLCGCGKTFKSCEFWTQVITDAFGGFDQVDVEGMNALRSSVQGRMALPALAFPFLRTASYKRHLAEYAGVLNQIYQSIRRVSDCRLIVDSSKVPPYAFLLSELPNVELHIVHLVRDSRATAFSWQRKKLRPEIHWKTAYMDQYSPFRSATEWGIMNTMLQLSQIRGANYRRVRYEDLVARPRETLLQIGAHVGEDWSDVNFLGRDVVQLGVDHTVSGNPDRFNQGTLKIKPDMEWKQKMAWRQKAVVTSITWPLLLRYGYLADRPIQIEHHDAPDSDGVTNMQSESL